MGTEFISKVFNKGVYTVKVGDSGSNKWETIEGLNPAYAIDFVVRGKNG